MIHESSSRALVAGAWRITGFLLTVAACALPIALFLLLQRYAVNVPVWDEWAVALLVIKSHLHTLTFSDLWAQHNEHRMLIAYLIMLGLAKFGGWNITREILFSLFLVVCSQVVLAVMLRKQLSGAWLAFTLLLTSLSLYAPVQAENWLWGFQIAWFLTGFFVIILAWLLVTHRAKGWAFWCALAIAIMASFTMSAGLLLWVVGFAVLYVDRLEIGRQRLIVWGIVAVGTILLYFHGWSKAGLQSNPAFIFSHPVEFVGYICAYLGSGLGEQLGLPSAIVLGVIALSAYVAFVVHYFRRRALSASDPEQAWLAIGLFAILTAAMTGLGRSAFGLDQALSSRYTTLSGLLWVALIALTVLACVKYADAANGVSVRQLRASLIAIVFIGFLGLSTCADLDGLHQMREIHSKDLVLLEILTRYRTANDNQLRELFPDADAVRIYLSQLQSVHDGPFYP